MEEETPKKNPPMTEERIKEIIKDYLKSSAFSARKITDTPTDDLQVVNRKYVTQNGTSSQRPTVKIVGQRYFDTTVNIPITWDGSAWRNGVGSVV